MDNNSVPINQTKDSLSDSVKQSAKPDGDVAENGGAQTSQEADAVADQSLIEIKQEIPVVDLLERSSTLNSGGDGCDGEEGTVKTEPNWLRKYEICEEVSASAEGDTSAKKFIKKESTNAVSQSTDGKTNDEEGSKGEEPKSESCIADTLILEIDNTDNLDAYFERSKGKVGIDNGNSADTGRSVVATKYLEKDTALKLTECTVTLNKLDANLTPDLINPKQNVDSFVSKKKTPKKIAKKEIAKRKLSTKLSKSSVDDTEVEKECDSKDIIRKKMKTETECKIEHAGNDQSHKDQGSTVTENACGEEKAVKIEKCDEKPAKLFCDSGNKFTGDDKKIEPRFIWISNISKTTKATDLKLHLSSHGKVVTAKIVTDGKLYYGYVVMEKREDVDNCIKNLDETLFEAKKIRLSDKGPEKKFNKNADQINVKTEKETDSLKEVKIEKTSTSELKPDKEKPCIVPKRKRSRSHDPLTLKVRKASKRFDRFSEESRKRKTQEILRKNRDRRSQEKRELIRRKREIEREREERRRQRIKDDEHKQTEMKLERERKKLERERELIERERLDLLRLQKKLADTERSMLNRQKVELERDLHNISEDYKKRRSPDDFSNRKTKFSRSEVEESRRLIENKEYWKNDRRTTPLKPKNECFEIESYQKKAARVESACVAPPPPILSDNFDLSDRRRKDKERDWEVRNYDKKEFAERQMFKDPKIFDRKVESNREYSFSERRGGVPEKSYGRDRYKPKDFTKYEKPPATNWEKFSSIPYKGMSATWRNDTIRPVQRNQPSVFPAPPQFGSTSGVMHYYPQPEYGRQNDFYGRPPERKY